MNSDELYRCPFLQANHFLFESIHSSKITNNHRTKCSLIKLKSIWEIIHRNKFKIQNKTKNYFD